MASYCHGRQASVPSQVDVGTRLSQLTFSAGTARTQTATSAVDDYTSVRVWRLFEGNLPLCQIAFVVILLVAASNLAIYSILALNKGPVLVDSTILLETTLKSMFAGLSTSKGLVEYGTQFRSAMAQMTNLHQTKMH